MPKPLSEQVVVITGASSGIGYCTARYFGRQGARVVATARGTDALEELVQEIEQGGGQALAVPGDVTREEDLRAVAQAAVERFGRIDTWVNNAGVYVQGRVQDISLEEFRRIIDVILLGYINGTKCALGHMLRQGSGGIILVSSVMAKRGGPYASPYAAAKAGIDGFAEAIRTELWGSGIRVSTLYPPTVDTPIYQHARGKFGTLPKPPPPVTDPATAARVIGELAEHPRNERTFGLFGHLYLSLSWLPSRLADGFLHRTADFGLSDRPDRGDNLNHPMDGPSRARGGWSAVGWRGLTLHETVKVLPWASVFGAAALGVVAGRTATWIRNYL